MKEKKHRRDFMESIPTSRKSCSLCLETGSDLRSSENCETFLQVQATWQREEWIKMPAEVFRR